MSDAQPSSDVKRFEEQGGAATMDPSPLRRWVSSRIATHVGSERYLLKQRRKAESQRKKSGSPHIVEYFHQTDDGYSHLALQKLAALKERYDIELRCHLVQGPSGDNLPEPELLLQLASYDAKLIAPHFGVSFPETEGTPSGDLVSKANRVLATLDGQQFPEEATRVSEALWRYDASAIEALASELGEASDVDTAAAIDAGTRRRTELKHYSGAMFYYGGEWYWGVDRLYHLENRLKSLGCDRRPEDGLLTPSNQIASFEPDTTAELTLEVFPSLRSPYTAVIFDKTLELAAESGVQLKVRPVLPMVMRGVPATMEKGIYIFTDAAREARALGVPFGKMADPIGEPVRRAYSLYPWVVSQGKGNEFLSSFLSAAFAEGINTNAMKGLRTVVERIGLSWSEAQGHLGDTAWEAEFEANRLAMYEAGLWGVPSYRLLDSEGRQVLAVWGQDRLWLVSKAMKDLLSD